MRCGIASELVRCGGGKQMINEETMQMEETKMMAEQEAWERLHQAIFKELFPQNRKAKSTNLRDDKSAYPHWAYVRPEDWIIKV